MATSYTVYDIFVSGVDVAAWVYTAMGPDRCAWLKGYWSAILGRHPSIYLHQLVECCAAELGGRFIDW